MWLQAAIQEAQLISHVMVFELNDIRLSADNFNGGLVQWGLKGFSLGGQCANTKLFKGFLGCCIYSSKTMN